MNISAPTGQLQASSVPFEKLSKNPNVSESDKVKEASRQFEAVLLRQILGEARKTVIHSSMNEESNESGIYSDMINNQMADSISRSGTFGLAKSLQAQLAHQVLPGTDKAQATDDAEAASASAQTQSVKQPVN